MIHKVTYRYVWFYCLKVHNFLLTIAVKLNDMVIFYTAFL